MLKNVFLMRGLLLCIVRESSASEEAWAWRKEHADQTSFFWLVAPLKACTSFASSPVRCENYPAGSRKQVKKEAAKTKTDRHTYVDYIL